MKKFEKWKKDREKLIKEFDKAKKEYAEYVGKDQDELSFEEIDYAVDRYINKKYSFFNPKLFFNWVLWAFIITVCFLLSFVWTGG